MTYADLIQQTLTKHYPRPPATMDDIRRFERYAGFSLPAEMVQFYLTCNGAKFYQQLDSPYDFLPLDQIIRGRMAIFGSEEEQYGPDSWLAFCDVRDGNYIGIDLDPKSEGHFAIMDFFHEAFPDPEYCEVIAVSFSHFLERVLDCRGESLYWLHDSSGDHAQSGG